MKAPPSRPDYLPKAPPPSTITFGVRISPYEFGGDMDIQSIPIKSSSPYFEEPQASLLMDGQQWDDPFPSELSPRHKGAVWLHPTPNRNYTCVVYCLKFGLLSPRSMPHWLNSVQFLQLSFLQTETCVAWPSPALQETSHLFKVLISQMRKMRPEQTCPRHPNRPTASLGLELQLFKAQSSTLFLLTCSWNLNNETF